MSCNTLDKRTRKPHSFVASNPREHQKPTTKRETRKQLRRSTVHLHHRSHEPMSRPFTGLSRQSSFHVLPTTCRPIPPNFDWFQRLKCHFLQRSSGRLPRFGGPGETPHKEGEFVQNASRGASAGRIAALTSMVPITYDKKLKKCLKLDQIGRAHV